MREISHLVLAEIEPRSSCSVSAALTSGTGLVEHHTVTSFSLSDTVGRESFKALRHPGFALLGQ